MNNQLYDVLEICLQEVEDGADIDTVLSHYPGFAKDLRPILETSMEARSLAAPDPSPEVIRRNRAKVMQQAAQMREAQARPFRRIWSVSLRRALVSLAVIAALFIGTNGLVYASSNTLPGDNLYPVKRTWEGVRVLLTFDAQARTKLEVHQENERLDELNNLFAKGRSASVDFAGTVTTQNGNLWLVSRIPVLISAQTNLGTQTIKVGDAIYVKGTTQEDGTVLAEVIQMLPANAPLPEIDDDHKQEIQSQNSGNQSVNPSDGEDHSNDSSIIQTPQESETQSPDKEATQENTSSGSSTDTSGSKDNPKDNSGSGKSDNGSSDNSGGGGNDSGSGGGD